MGCWRGCLSEARWRLAYGPADATCHSLSLASVKSRLVLPFRYRLTRLVPENTRLHPFNGPLSGTTQVSRYQKGKTNLDFTEARDSEWQWNPLGHMQVCTSLQADNHTSTPLLSFFTGRMPFLPPNQQRQSTEGTEKGPEKGPLNVGCGRQQMSAMAISSVFFWGGGGAVLRHCLETRMYSSSFSESLRLGPLSWSQVFLKMHVCIESNSGQVPGADVWGQTSYTGTVAVVASAIEERRIRGTVRAPPAPGVRLTCIRVRSSARSGVYQSVKSMHYRSGGRRRTDRCGGDEAPSVRRRRLPSRSSLPLN